jgi:hypothetical protein
MNDKQDIGKRLVEYSLEAEAFSANRGVMDEFFPYIYEASRRMSLRAIGRWLLAEHQISISPNTLARAMRNPEKYWIQILEDLEPSVWIVARAHDASPSFVLSSVDVIQQLSSRTPTFSVGDGSAERSLEEYDKAVEAVRAFWSGMPVNALKDCLAYVGKVFEEDTETGAENDGEKHERKAKR